MHIEGILKRVGRATRVCLARSWSPAVHSCETCLKSGIFATSRQPGIHLPVAAGRGLNACDDCAGAAARSNAMATVLIQPARSWAVCAANRTIERRLRGHWRFAEKQHLSEVIRSVFCHHSQWALCHSVRRCAKPTARVDHDHSTADRRSFWNPHHICHGHYWPAALEERDE